MNVAALVRSRWPRHFGRVAMQAALVAGFAAASLSIATTAHAQDSTRRAPTPGRIRGRVVADSGGAPIVDAEVIIAAAGRRVRTDSLGRYDLANLDSGSTLIEVRAIGFRPETTTVRVRERLIIGLELRLAFDDIAVVRPRAAPAQALPAVTTTGDQPDASGKMAEFFSRKEQGIGRFMTRAEISKWDNRRTSEMLETLGGLKIQLGGMKAWATNGRVPASSCVFCRTDDVTTILNPADFSTGARPACFMDVYLDGALVFQFGNEPPQQLFDLNAIAPESIEGIEVYSGPSQVPAKFNTRLGSGCGLIAVWTRISPDKKP